MTVDSLRAGTQAAGAGGSLETSRIPPRLVRLFTHVPTARVLAWCCFVAFSLLAAMVLLAEGALLVIDREVQQSVMDSRSGWMNNVMIAATFLGTRQAIGVLLGGLVLWSLVTGRGRPVVFLIAAAVLFNPIFEVGFKELVGRVRPDLAQLVPGNGPSFPSGHVLASVGFYGMLPLMAWEVSARSRPTWVASLASLMVIGVVAASRVYLDVHWTSDVVGGLLLGTVLVIAAHHAYVRAHARPPGSSVA